MFTMTPPTMRYLSLVLLALLLTGTACSQGTISGELEKDDPTLSNGEFYDTYTLDVEAGEWIEVDLTSDDFDTYVVVQAPSGANEQNDDYEGATSRSYLRFRAEESGTWSVFATSYAGGETGRYRLAMNVGDGTSRRCDDCEAPVQLVSSSDNARIEHGDLAANDQTLTSGEYVDEYQVQGRQGEHLVLDLRSSDFDPYLILKLPSGEQIENDDHEGDRTRSLITSQLPETGTYRVLVTSYQPKETGAYDLTIRGGGGNDTAFEAAAGVRNERGALASGDATLRSGEFYDTFTFEGVPGQRVHLDLRADGFDPYLVLQPPRGNAASIKPSPPLDSVWGSPYLPLSFGTLP